ncbi:hypothetical protein [Mycobacterium sp. NPDC050041]|uniref:hypothetical protein n=1 Tax=Mycobacterium sp. NPDC050041 TaxID=3364293 RepID=UPI003C308256
MTETPAPAQPKGILATIGNAIWSKLEPLITSRLDEIQAIAKTEADEWQVIAQQQLDEWRADAMKMLSEALPEMAGAIAEQAVKTTFEHTQVDEAANAVSGVITDIVGRLRFPFGGGR